MDNKNVTRYFLGANTKYGFYSLYDEIADTRSGDFLWVIKGGPGCGKSSFMKKIGRAAENKGKIVEYIHCSGDPNSLDGIWLPELRTGYVDGTAPHVMEAEYPGSASLYLDLGTFYDAGALEGSLSKIISLNARYKALYTSAYAYLSAAAAVSPQNRTYIWGEAEKSKIDKKIAGFAAREFKHGGGAAVRHRFLSSIGCDGRVFMEDTLKTICDRVCTLDNELGMAYYYLDRLVEVALLNNLSITICPDPLVPEKIQAVLIPELSLGFLAIDSDTKFSGEAYRHIRLDALADHDAVAAVRSKLRRDKKLSNDLINNAVETFSEANALHNELEEVYNPHVDFAGLYATAQDHISWLFENS